VTQQGTNQFHGSLFEFLRNNGLNARNFYDPDAPPGFQRNRFGGSLGGPIRKNKTFVFDNYAPFRQHLHQTSVDLAPDANARNGLLPCALVQSRAEPLPVRRTGVGGVSPLISLWPAPTPGAPDFGGIAEAFNTPLQTLRDDFGITRLEHNFSENDFLSEVYTVDDSAGFTPASTNLYSADVESLREQVAPTGVSPTAGVITSTSTPSRQVQFGLKLL
jgi:hypothetical protein